MRSALATSSDKMKATFDPLCSPLTWLTTSSVRAFPAVAHRISGRCVAKSEWTGMNGFSFEYMKEIDECFEPNISKSFNYKTSVESRSTTSGMSTASVLDQIEMLSAILE